MYKIGKVRILEKISDNKILIKTTDRQSAFNKYICDIPNKGKLQTKLTNFWFDKTKHIIENHFQDESANT